VHKELLFDLALLALSGCNIWVVPYSNFTNSFRALHFLVELMDFKRQYLQGYAK